MTGGMRTTTTTSRPESPLRAARHRKRLNQERLAALSGVSRGWVGYLERNPECMTWTAAERFAAALGCSPDDLMIDGGRR